MHIKTAIIPFLFILVLTGCGPIVTFEEPQPGSRRTLNSFPKRMHGNYLSQDGNTIVSIDGQLIIKTTDYDLKTHKDSVTKYARLKGDTLFSDSTNYQMVKIIGDSIVVEHVHYTDTIFSISDDNVLKKFKGYYFLNSRMDTARWIVQKLSLVKGILSIANIASSQDIEVLKELTENKSDTTSYNFSLTRKQFRQFINLEGFHDRELFIRMKQNNGAIISK